MTFLGYQPGCKSYQFLGDSKEVVLSRSADFQEDVGWDKLHGNDVPETVTHPLSDNGKGDPKKTHKAKVPQKGRGRHKCRHSDTTEPRTTDSTTASPCGGA